MTKNNKKIIVGMSGGVDSSMALVLLKKQGWEPIGVSLKLPVWESKENLLRENVCCTAKSLNIAKNICHKLKIPYYIYNVKKDFTNKVVDYFINEFKNQKTPNPCIICNRYLKFASLFRITKKFKIKYVATGHFARIKDVKSKMSDIRKLGLFVAKDNNKDQTYSLCFLTQRQLKHIVFPLGDYTKNEVYELAKEQGFDFFLKTKQSQDFCFVAGKSLPFYLKQKIGRKPGKIIDEKANILGKHNGLHFYTLGQRKGLPSGGPYYVEKFDFQNNYLIVTKDKKKIVQKEIILAPFNFISGMPPKKPLTIMAKVRYRQPLSKAILYPPKNNQLKLVFEKPQAMVTPGQFAVFYSKNICLGGGRIN